MRISTKVVSLGLCFFLAASSWFHAQEAGSQDIQSCRNFVQAFYNWYVVGKDKIRTLEETLRYKRDAFSPELFRLLKDTQVDNGEEGEGLDSIRLSTARIGRRAILCARSRAKAPLS